jgi:hypothetical protein
MASYKCGRVKYESFITKRWGESVIERLVRRVKRINLRKISRGST